MMRLLYWFWNERHVSRLFSQHEFEVTFGADVMRSGRCKRCGARSEFHDVEMFWHDQ